MALTTASYDIGQKLFSGAANELVNFDKDMEGEL